MSNVRNPEDLVGAVVELQNKLTDMENTMMARLIRRPTGDIEPTMLLAPKPYTLFLRGQSLLRDDFPVLWQWIQNNSLVIPGGFSNGNGTTTFGLPDWMGKTVVGAGGAYTANQDVGSDTKTISISNMPSHSHFGGTQNAGSHGGHVSSFFNSVALAGGGSSTVASGTGNNGDHWHGIDDDGNGTPISVVQSGKAINWMIYF